jgi:putative flippase GtrA
MISITWSYVIAFSAATTIGFFGHSYFTFDVGQAHLKNLILFIFQASLSFLIGFLSLKILINLQVPVMLAKLIQLGITFFFNFTVGKFITFKKRRGIL